MTQKALYRKAAIAALKNSQSVYRDARLLFEHDRSGRAFALAVVADEELAKAILYVVAAYNGPDALPGLRRVVRSHGPKQDLIEFVAHIAEFAQPGYDEAYRIGRAVASGELKLEEGIDPVEYAMDRASEKMEAATGEGPVQGGGIELFDAGRVQTLKNACLYVDVLPSGELCTPVTDGPSHSAIAEYLDGVKNRLSFVGWVIAGNKDHLRLEPQTLDLIRRAWDATRSSHRL